MTADAVGDATFSSFVPANLAGTTLYVQALDRSTCATSQVQQVDF